MIPRLRPVAAALEEFDPTQASRTFGSYGELIRHVRGTPKAGGNGGAESA